MIRVRMQGGFGGLALTLLGIFVVASALALVAVFSFDNVAYAASCTEAYDKTGAVPAGYGAAYNLFSTGKEITVQADCTPATPVLNAGSGAASQYIYKLGYAYKGGVWQQVNLTGSGALISSNWYAGSASGPLPLTATELSSNWNYIVSYICNWTGTMWKCGCADTACATSSWQLQAVKSTAPLATTQNAPLFFDTFANSYGNWNVGMPWDAGVNVYNTSYVQVDPAVSPSLNPFSTVAGGLKISVLKTSDPAAQGRPYATGLLSSKFTRVYGYFEFQAIMPSSPGGIDGALWLYPTGASNNAEIDVIEHTGNYVMQTVWDGSTHNPTQNTDVSVTALHTYSVDWQSDFITFYIDNIQTFKTVTPANLKTVPMMLILSDNVTEPLAVGTTLPDSMIVKSAGVWVNKASRDAYYNGQ